MCKLSSSINREAAANVVYLLDRVPPNEVGAGWELGDKYLVLKPDIWQLLPTDLAWNVQLASLGSWSQCNINLNAWV